MKRENPLKKVFLLALLSLFVASAFAAEEDRGGSRIGLPRVVLTRVFEYGSSESLSLRCTPDLKGRQEFFCDVLRHRNGVEVATTSLYAKQTKAILQSFFQLMPKSKPQDAGEAKALDPQLIWEVTYDNQSAKGYVLRSEKQTDENVLKAILTLEGALASQFYR